MVSKFIYQLVLSANLVGKILYTVVFFVVIVKFVLLVPVVFPCLSPLHAQMSIHKALRPAQLRLHTRTPQWSTTRYTHTHRERKKLHHAFWLRFVEPNRALFLCVNLGLHKHAHTSFTFYYYCCPICYGQLVWFSNVARRKFAPKFSPLVITFLGHFILGNLLINCIKFSARTAIELS